MRDKLRIGDVVRVQNRNRNEAPCHGDIGKVLNINAQTVDIRLLRQCDGGMTRVGSCYQIRSTEVERLDKDQQVALIDMLIQSEREKVEETNRNVEILEKRKAWLVQYGSEEEALVSVIYELIASGNSDRKSVVERATAIIKGKLTLI